MSECDFERMQIQRRCLDAERLHFADFTAGQVCRVAAHGPTQMCEMNSDLVGASGDGAGFEEGRVVREAFEDAEFGAGG